MRSLFITGTTGFIGRQFLKTLDPKEYRQVVSLGRAQGGDLRNPDSYVRDLEGCDTVVHLAAATGRASRKDLLEVNAEGTRALVRQCERLGGRDFLFVSTIAVKYPDKRHYPYAESKELGEAALRESGLRYAIVRPTIVMGRESPIWRSLFGLARRRLIIMPGNGRAVVQPIHVDDLVAALIALVREGRFAGETFEVGGADALSFEDFLRRVHRMESGREPTVFHLPLRPLVETLALLERPLGGKLPVTAGQLSAFAHDSAADALLALPMGSARPLGVDDIIRRCVGTAQGPEDTGLARECVVFARYLTGQATTAYVREKYSDAHARCDQLQPSVGIDRLLLRSALAHPLGAWLVDAYTAVFLKKALVRKKWVLLVAILEASAPSADHFDVPDPGGRGALLARLAAKGAAFALGLCLSTLVFLPSHVILGAASGRRGRP